jgi:hypothetical protein
MVVQALMTELGVSQHRAYGASGIARTTRRCLRYRPVACDDSAESVLLHVRSIPCW